MRRPALPLLLLSFTLLLAGCASDPGSSGGDGAAGTPSAPAGGSPAAAEPFADVRLEHDHTQGATEEANFTVPAGLGPVTFEVYFRGVQGTNACATAGPEPARIVVKDPSGEVVADQGPGTSGVSLTTGNERCSGQMTRVGVTLAPGVWTVAFSGRAALVGVVSVVQDA